MNVFSLLFSRKIWYGHIKATTNLMDTQRTCSDRARFTSNAPHGMNSIRWIHLNQFKVVERIIAWEPAHRWGMTVLEINAPILKSMAEEIVLSEDNGVTRLRFCVGLEFRGIGRLLRRPLVTRQSEAIKIALANLAASCSPKKE